jgi:hypothetical protein
MHDDRSNIVNEVYFMALISRRRLSKSLQRNAAVVSQAKLKDWVARLNTIHDDYVAAEWELILLESFSNFGEVQYEPSQKERIDIIFDDGRVSFAADITTASDRFLHRRNPVGLFSEELGRQLRKSGIIRFGGFSYDIWQNQGVLVRDHHRSALLPHASTFRETIFNDRWIEFVRLIRANPTVQHTYYAFVNESKIKIFYSPSLKGHITGSFGGYTGANVLTENPLYNSLREKARKLKKCSYSGPLGIIVCDGGCRMLTTMPSWETYSIREIVSEFFRQHHSIHFVGIIGVQSRISSAMLLKPQHYYLPALYVRSDIERDISAVGEIMDRAVKRLPAIKTAPENAINDLKWHRPKAPYRPYLGGWTYSDSALTLSARELLEVISGRMPHDVFKKNHELANGANSFLMRIARGQHIAGIRLCKREDEDDDVVMLEFGLREGFKTPSSSAPKEWISDRMIRVGAQELLLFLAGTIGVEEFNRHIQGPTNFSDHLAAGELFSDLTFQGDPAARDGRIVFVFGSTDPAIAPFQIPNLPHIGGALGF